MREFKIIKNKEYFNVKYRGELIETHRENELKILTRREAELLIEDFEKNFNGEYTSNHSLLYCYLSTKSEFVSMSEVERIEKGVYEFDIETSIQWDRAFRLNPGPPLRSYEMRYVRPVQQWLSEDYIDLPLNYASRISDIDPAQLVPERTVNKVSGLIDHMPKDALPMADILNVYFESVSPTFVLLFLSGKITSEEFIGAVHTFLYSVDVQPVLDYALRKTEKKDESDYAGGEFDSYLKKVMYDYNNVEQLRLGISATD